MKTKIAILLTTGLLALPAFSASYSINAGAGAEASGIQDSLGRAFRGGTLAGSAFLGAAGGTSAGGGVVAVGVFSQDTFAGLSASSIVSLFTNFGNSTTAFSAGGSGGNRGVFSLGTSLQVAGNSTFLNKNIYLFAGNGGTFATSSEFFIFKSTNLFTAAADESPTATEVVFNTTTASGQPLFGSIVTDMKTSSSDTTVSPGFKMATTVPEPSTALLGAFGALGLIRRRRN